MILELRFGQYCLETQRVTNVSTIMKTTPSSHKDNYTIVEPIYLQWMLDQKSKMATRKENDEIMRNSTSYTGIGMTADHHIMGKSQKLTGWSMNSANRGEVHIN